MRRNLVFFGLCCALWLAFGFITAAAMEFTSLTQETAYRVLAIITSASWLGRVADDMEGRR